MEESLDRESSCSALEKWLHGSKARWVTITHDDGYGACAGWEVTLGEGKLEKLTCGFNRDRDDWDTLEETISRALLSIVKN